MSALSLIRILVAALGTLLVLAPLDAWAGKPETAYAQARADYLKLRGDEKLRKFRHHWQNAQKKLEKAAQGLGSGELGAEAYFTLGELCSDLSRFSSQREDLEAAEAAFEKVTSQWPRHRLADDAALARAKLLEQSGDLAAARRALESAPDGDRKKEIAALLQKLPAPRVDKPADRSSKAALAKPTEKPLAAEKSEPAAPKKHADDVEKLDSDDRSAMGEAIRKAILTRDGRRVAPEESRPTALPRREPERLADEEDEAAGPALRFPRLSELQERLRDVRVGPAAKEPKLDDPLARSRLKQMVKDGAQSELTLAEQLGLKMRRVIIDAGHGGHDTGAIGPTGVQEKDVALAIALKTAKKLSDAGLEVVLTRDDDTFVRLEDRSRLANQQRGDLFVSIHCNAAPSRGLRGVETYSLNTSSDRYSVRLAARENATAERGVSDLQLILADLATKANTTESQRLAGRVQRSMVGALAEHNKGLRDLGTKEALFYVLLGAKMPSILVETSFISNPDEEKLLASDAYQADVAAAIADAVEGYVSDRDEKLAKIE